MYSVDVHPYVYAELEHSRIWYEERSDNLGREFLDQVDRAIETVRDSPDIWPFHDEDRQIRRYLVHRFPYGVVYKIRNQTIQIIAVMHLRRHPDYWKGRVSYWDRSNNE
jgi:toxin ParE1/3/4